MARFHHPSIKRAGGAILYGLVRSVMSTMDIRGIVEDAASDPASPFCRRRGIYVFWHEYITIPFYLRGHCEVSMLLSRHRDAEWLAHAADLMGFGTVRGSSNWGSVSALKKLVKISKSQHLAITPDGPNGPRRVLAPGPIFLASKLGMPVIPMGYGFNQPFRMNTWDRFAVPKLFSSARVIVGKPIEIPDNLSKESAESYRTLVESVLNRLTLSAEEWAESGLRAENEWILRSMASPVRSRRNPAKVSRYWKRDCARPERINAEDSACSVSWTRHAA